MGQNRSQFRKEATREMGEYPGAVCVCVVGRGAGLRLFWKTVKGIWMFCPKRPRPRQRGAMVRWMSWLGKGGYELETKLVGGRSRFGHIRRTLPQTLPGTLWLRGSAGRSMAGFRDCEDRVLNSRDTAASDAGWNVPHRQHPECWDAQTCKQAV